MPRALANGIHLNYIEAGMGSPPLLLLHGVGGSHEMWLPILPALAASRRVVAGDHRGHGGSDKPPGPYTVRLLADDWVAALDVLDIPRVDVLGLSLGGAVAMRLAADHPARVRRLVLVDTWGLPHQDFLGMMLHRVTLLEREDLKGYADLAIGQVHSQAYLAGHPEAIDAYRARVAQADARCLLAAIGACMGHDMRHELPRITAPALVLAGREDRLTPPPYSEHLARVIPNATLVIVEGSAHFPHLEAPETFLKVVESFLQ